MKATLLHYKAAGYPAVAIATADEDRAIGSILTDFPKSLVMRVASMGGITNARDGSAIDEKAAYPAAFARCSGRENNVLIVLDFQHIIKNAGAYRTLRDALPLVKSRGALIVLIAPSWTLPAELEHDMPVINDALPSRDEINAALEVCKAATNATVENSAALLDAASGLTIAEAENAFALAYAVDGTFNPLLVSDEKMKRVRQSGLVEISKPADISELGGLGELQRCIREEIIPSMADREIAASGMILDGVPGTGKSLSARIISGMLGWPCLRVDIARLKGSLVGQSESNIISVFKLARAIAPVVLFFDELEKGVGGFASSAQSDSGVTLGMVGTILTQLQEIRDNNEKIFVIATTNDYQKLPAELTRRLEIKFFVDLPSREEREEIAAKKLAKFCNGFVKESYASDIADMSEKWTGAEIEDLVRSAARRSRRNITLDVLKAAAADIKPIALVRSEEISKLREWGHANLRLANTKQADTPTPKTRKVAKHETINSSIADVLSGGNA